MKTTARRGRLIRRIRWRAKKLGGVSRREDELMQETKLYRTLRVMFPEAQEWQVHSVIRSMGYGRYVAEVRVNSVFYRGRTDIAIYDEAFLKSYGEEPRNIPFSKMVDGRRENVMLTRSEWEAERKNLG